MLITKLHVQSRSRNLLSRPYLFKKLDQALSKRLTLISAPAGYGKTSILSDWIHKNKIPVAWISIDKRDQDPIRFLKYLIVSIDSVIEDFSENTLKLVRGPRRPDPESILAHIINEISGTKKHVLIVLDDFHLIDSPEIYALIKYLIDNSSDKIHLIISTRSDPPIPFSRLRSQGELMEIRISDLSFSSNEIMTLFNKVLKLGLRIEDIKSLEIKTEGWIAGLQLIALSLKGRKDKSKFIENFAGDHRYIMDYLLEEVLESQTERVRKFLLNTAFFEQFSAELCDEVLGLEDSQEIIEFLEIKNMFIIPLDNERCWYRYHHLFSDLLKQGKNTIKDKEKDIYHKKASLWFKNNGNYPLAIEHAVEAGDLVKAAELLNSVAEKFWKNGQHDLIMKFGKLFSQSILEKNPEFCTFYAWILISTSHLDKAEKFIKLAEKSILYSLKADPGSNGKHLLSELLGKVYISYTYLLSSTGKNEKIHEYCDLAKKHLAKNDPIWQSWLWYSYGIAYLTKGQIPESVEDFKRAYIYAIKTGNLFLLASIVIRIAYGSLRQGAFHESHKYCTQLISSIHDGGSGELLKGDWSYARLYSILAYVQFMWNKLDEAEENGKRGYDLANKGNDVSQKIFNSIVYAKILRAKNNHREFGKIWNTLNDYYWEKIPYYLQLTFCAWKVSLLIDKNELEEAQLLLDQYEVGPDFNKNYAKEFINISYARLLLKKSEIKVVEKFILEIYEIAITGKRIERSVEIGILLSILYKTKGERAKAIKILEETIILAEKEKLLMFFIEDRTDIHNLLKEVFSQNIHRKNTVPLDFLKTILESIESTIIKEKRATNILSARELDVLKLISKQISNQEIADKLFVSKNTIKTHAKNIYAKLEVPNRQKAVLRAQKLGIL